MRSAARREKKNAAQRARAREGVSQPSRGGKSDRAPIHYTCTIHRGEKKKYAALMYVGILIYRYSELALLYEISRKEREM